MLKCVLMLSHLSTVKLLIVLYISWPLLKRDWFSLQDLNKKLMHLSEMSLRLWLEGLTSRSEATRKLSCSILLWSLLMLARVSLIWIISRPIGLLLATDYQLKRYTTLKLTKKLFACSLPSSHLDKSTWWKILLWTAVLNLQSKTGIVLSILFILVMKRFLFRIYNWHQNHAIYSISNSTTWKLTNSSHSDLLSTKSLKHSKIDCISCQVPCNCQFTKVM